MASHSAQVEVGHQASDLIASVVLLTDVQFPAPQAMMLVVLDNVFKYRSWRFR